MYKQKNLIFIFLFATLSCFGNNNKVTLTVNFDSLIQGSIVIRGWTTDNKSGSMKIKTLDSCDIKEKTYLFKYEYLDQPMLIYMQIYENSSTVPTDIRFHNKYVSFIQSYNMNMFLDNSNAKIIIHKKERDYYRSDVFNSPETELFYKLSADGCTIYDRTKKSKRRYTNNLDMITNDSIISQNPDSKYLLSYINDSKNRYTSCQELDHQLKLFSKPLQQSLYGKEILDYINRFKKENITSFFYFSDVFNKKYTFKEFIKDKKYGLLIFWASWCAPCRSEIPELKKLYEKYRNKVAFVSLSIDKKEKEWITAVNKENMPWLNLSGLPSDPNKVLKLFNAHRIPTFIVVDSTGKIILNTTSGYTPDINEKKAVTVEYLDDFLNLLK